MNQTFYRHKFFHSSKIIKAHCPKANAQTPGVILVSMTGQCHVHGELAWLELNKNQDFENS